ncbi:MAG: hypothetical protein Q9224_003633, partial [Gallowayella concinna]
MAAKQDLITRSQILEYRTVTTLLSYTNAFQQYSEHERHDRHGGQVSDLRKADKVLLEKMGHFSKLVVRDSEVVALMPVKDKPGMPIVTLAVKPLQNLHHPCQVASDAEDGRGGQQKDVSKPRVDLWPSNTIQIQNNRLGIAFFFLQNPSLDFPDHCNVVLHLLKEHHSALNSIHKRRTFRQLEQWIVLSSCKGLMKRFQAGNSELHPWHYLVEIDDAALEAQNPDYEDVLEYTLYDEPHDLSQRLVTNGLIKAGLLPRDSRKSPFFNKEGRSRFRRALQGLLKETSKAVTDLATFLDSEGQKQCNDTGYRADDSVCQRLLDLAWSVRNLTKTLCDIETLCEAELTDTLEWISSIFNLH